MITEWKNICQGTQLIEWYIQGLVSFGFCMEWSMCQWVSHVMLPIANKIVCALKVHYVVLGK